LQTFYCIYAVQFIFGSANYSDRLTAQRHRPIAQVRPSRATMLIDGVAYIRN